MSNSFRIKKIIGDKIYYTTIELEAKPIPTYDLKISFDSSIDQEWYSSVDAAIRFFHEHYLRIENKGLSVSIKSLHTMLGDTTPIIVFYATVQCLSEGLSFSNDLIVLNENTGKFEVSK